MTASRHRLPTTALLAMTLMAAFPATAQAQGTREEIVAATEYRQETLARTIGSLAYIYAYPMVDYERLMYLQTNPGLDPTGAYAPVNRFYSVGKLTLPGGPFAGRSPNSDTLYFQAWYDVSQGPAIIDAPDTGGRYYNLDFVNFFSETDAHTGSRTTGDKAQQVYLVGPTWKGTAPAGMNMVRMKTDRGIVFGRVLIKGAHEVKTVSALVNAFKMAEAPGTPAPPKPQPVKADILGDIDFFVLANRYLKSAAPIEGEQALLDQFDLIGIGPKSTFDPAKITPATRRGLEAAIADARKAVEQARMWDLRGWAPVKTKIGVYGTDYFQRAAIEYSGLLANAPEEAVYPRYRSDLAGNPLNGTKRYRIVVPKDMPVDAFWSLTSYGGATRDLIPNDAGIYSVGDRDPKLIKRQKDGSAVILIQADKPKDKSANWLPVKRESFYLLMRLYRPRPEAFAPGYKLPEIEVCDESGACAVPQA